MLESAMLRILNKEDLSRSRLRRDALEILEEGLRAADPRESIKETLEKIRGEIHGYRRVFIIGFGKASVSMAMACEELLGEFIYKGVVIAPDGVNDTGLERIRVLRGTHPLPSERNIESTRELLSTCSGLSREDLVICLVSGGGSALLVLPAEGVSLKDKIRTTEYLLRCGAEIKEINIVRKHLSSIKGGQLLRFLKPAKVISLIVSDIVGDPVEHIASGPTYHDSSTFSDAYRIIMKYGLLEKLPRSVIRRIERGLKGEIEETPKPGEPLFNDVENIIVSNNSKSLMAMKRKAAEIGYNASILTSFSEGEAREIGRFLCGIVKQIHLYNSPARKPACLILGGEMTVTVKGSGKGGRNQELVLSMLSNLIGINNFLVASIGSDGVDGYTDAAGAIADSSTLEKASLLGLNPKDFLNDNDSYSFFRQTGDLVFTGPTGTNVNDFSVIMVY
ncbi:MAG: glycerate kinase type-2 family protein [Thermoproteota archaeon]